LNTDLFIPGVSREDLTIIQERLGLNSLSELKKAAKGRKIRKLAGLGSKTEMAVLRGIKLLEASPEFLPSGIVTDFSKMLIDKLKTWPNVSQVLIVGDLRRGCAEVNKIEFLLETDDFGSLSNFLLELPGLKKEIIREKDVISFSSALGLPVIFHLATPFQWGTRSILTTGSEQHVQALKKITPTLPLTDREEKIYNKMGLSWIPPEIRETGREVQLALEGNLPKLIDIKMVKGDLHLHSRWSDGVNTIEEIIQQAIRLGYDYIAITDHSQSLKVAGGLSPQDLFNQGKEISLLQKKYPQIKILKGIEVDILEDGSLDFTDDILNSLDMVIASVHSYFHMSEEDMTRRVVKALQNPYVKILAHPTGRILGKRTGYAIDINKVIDTAVAYNKILEINASPDRLDLRDTHLQIAKTKGAKIAINTDAHNLEKMKDMVFGVQTARRGWQTIDDIINCWSYEKLEDQLKIKK